MRILAVLPALMCTVALVLSFLCLFAGSKRNFMEDYAIVTLNTSQIGQDLPIFDEISNSISDSVSNNLRRDAEAEPNPVVNSAPEITARAILPRQNGAPADLVVRQASWVESVWSDGTEGVASLYTKATGAIPIPTQAVAAVDWLKKEGHQLSEELVQEAENLTTKFENLIEDGLGDFAQVLGIHDFYSAHVMNFCEGFYVPASVPNATVAAGSIHKNVTYCSNKTAMYHFDPMKEISQELNESTGGFIDLSTVQFPDDVRDALNALKVAQRAVFVLYCVTIGLIFLGFVGAIMGIFFNGWMSALINVAADGLAFVSITVASALITYIANRATRFINKHGDEIGISANRGNKFLALTWATTGLMFIAMIIWMYLTLTSVRASRQRRRALQEKHG